MTKAEQQRQEKAYNQGQKEGWKKPNTTDVHSLKNLKSITAYICKYFTKAPDIQMPKLEANQKLVKENGTYYVETTTTTDDTEWGVSGVWTDREAFTPVFLTRVGASGAQLKCSKTPKPCPRRTNWCWNTPK